MKVNASGAKEHRKSSLANLSPLCYNIEVIALLPPRCHPEVWSARRKSQWLFLSGKRAAALGNQSKGSKLHSVELRPLRLRNTTAMLQPSISASHRCRRNGIRRSQSFKFSFFIKTKRGFRLFFLIPGSNIVLPSLSAPHGRRRIGQPGSQPGSRTPESYPVPI